MGDAEEQEGCIYKGMTGKYNEDVPAFMMTSATTELYNTDYEPESCMRC
jgi:hypothetical protein